MQAESDLVTGDAVVLELRLAQLASRSVAFALDVLVQAALLLLALLLLAGVGDVDGALLGAIMLTLAVLVLVGYPATAETLSHGRTLGKLAMGLRTVRDDGGPIRFRHALTRALAGFFVDFWALGFLGTVAMTVSLCSAKGKRVGDFLAGTVVIRERAPEDLAVTTATIAMPPSLADWAARLDLSNLPDDLALAGRQYLGRYGTLGEAAREQLGHRLAGEVAERIGAPVPAWVPPWAYLSAVLAERRNREYAGRYGQPPAQHAPPPQQSQPPPQSQPPAAPPAAPTQDTDNPFTPPG
ncbi:Uncharacterized membrane protein YckC, RDD family [Amycolatopsis marina]|uniref:Uncharacterized membrane protein YckC, RDD family n=1 Tax=Amycolatopsis marina TaxID=490629 RepID=A0A1I1BS29_9PSEU|nr:RDD family protein [Amycolatopsis marina]SFB51240.1 Uncharacterized membrane protein YckC, RDD family [Amycolatopsis marina]